MAVLTCRCPTLCTLKRLHGDLLQQYDCTEQSAVAQPAQPSAQAAALLPTRAHQLPGSQDQQSQHLPKSVIPTQRRVTEQLTKNWSSFKVLRQRYAGTRFEEQRQLHLPQKHKATVADSTLRVDDDVVYWYLIQ